MTPRIGLHFAQPVLFGMMAGKSNADPWKSDVDQIDPAKYYGAIAVHVMIGMLPSDPPLMVKEIVLKGAYDRDGPFMNYPLLDILHERLGKKKTYPLCSYPPDERPAFGVLAEATRSNKPHFATGQAAGFWLSQPTLPKLGKISKRSYTQREAPLINQI